MYISVTIPDLCSPRTNVSFAAAHEGAIFPLVQTAYNIELLTLSLSSLSWTPPHWYIPGIKSAFSSVNEVIWSFTLSPWFVLRTLQITIDLLLFPRRLICFHIEDTHCSGRKHKSYSMILCPLLYTKRREILPSWDSCCAHKDNVKMILFGPWKHCPLGSVEVPSGEIIRNIYCAPFRWFDTVPWISLVGSLRSFVRITETISFLSYMIVLLSWSGLKTHWSVTSVTKSILNDRYIQRDSDSWCRSI